MAINFQLLLRYIPFLVGFIFIFCFRIKYKEKKLDDLYLYVMLAGLIGARLSYAIFNVGLFQYDWTKIISISQYNLNLLGGLITSFLVFLLLCKKYKLASERYVKLFTMTVFVIFIMSSIVNVYMSFKYPFNLTLISRSTSLYLVGVYSLGLIMNVFASLKFKHTIGMAIFIVVMIAGEIVKII